MLMKVFIIIFLVGGAFILRIAANIDVRLVGNRTHFPYGRVQVLHNGTWGTLCSRRWNLNGGHVICRQLGFDGAMSAFIEYWHKPGTQWMNNLQCRGNESSISECIYGSWELVTYCVYHAIAMCTLRVRLTEGLSAKEGLVQVYINNTWGRVCGEQWDKQDAEVVCRWLGYQASSAAYTTYLQISADMWMSNVQCNGNEDSLFTCAYDDWTNTSCTSNRMAGARCSGSEVKLASGGPLMDVLVGGFWGPVCSSFQWQLQNANVFCRQLGYHGALVVSEQNLYGRNLEICLNNMQCIGNESSILRCKHDGWTSGNNVTRVVCLPTAARVVEGPSFRQGLVQMYYNRTWGWACAEQWDKQEADVVCKELGYTGSSSIYNGSTGARRNDTLFMNNIHCTGNEGSLVSCAHGGWTHLGCRFGQIAGVVCTGREVRLVSRGSSLPPRMEVLSGGFWGPVCSSYNLDAQNANVFCRQLGYDGALAESNYEEQNSEICLDVDCIGNESSILVCRSSRWTSDSFITSVLCSPKVRLVEGPSFRQGLVQLYYNRTWGWACAEQWDKQEADVVCKELGYTGSSSIYNGSTGARRNNTLFMNNIHCTGNEGSLVSCAHGGWTHLGCRVGQIAGVVCTGREARLVSRGSSLPPRMEVLSGGFWGPVCSSYNLDAQNANVFCRQLGYDGALAESNYEKQNSEICLDVDCVGNESSILVCRSSRWTSDSFITSVLCSPKVRLVEGPSAREGLVQVYYNRTWGWICADQWDKQDGDVVCRELGYTGSSTIYNKSPYVRGNFTLLMSDIRCTGNESSLLSCTHGGWKFLGCGAVGQTAGVVCAGPEVRLLSNDSPSRRVEILSGGFWGPVCSYQWDQKEANVVCRQLGHGDALAASVQFFMHLNTVLCLGLECSGNESSVLLCRHGGWSSDVDSGDDDGHSGILVASAICSPTGGPEYVSAGLDSVYMTWISSQSLSYTVQMWNNKTGSWKSARCYESTTAGSCVVDASGATILGLTPSSTYFFRIIVDNMTISATSKPMKTKELGAPGRPLHVSNTFTTITIKWNSPHSLHDITYTVQMQTDTDAFWVDAKCDDQSLLPNRCVIKGSVAIVTGLKRNTVYRFRVYAMFKGVRSDFSLPSDSIRTADGAAFLRAVVNTAK